MAGEGDVGRYLCIRPYQTSSARSRPCPENILAAPSRGPQAAPAAQTAKQQHDHHVCDAKPCLAKQLALGSKLQVSIPRCPNHDPIQGSAQQRKADQLQHGAGIPLRHSPL